MKRAASPPNTERPVKVARVDASDAFDPANERDASLLEESLDTAGFISGTIAMAFPPIRDILKLQLSCISGWQLAVEIRGAIVRTLRLKIKSSVKIALRNGHVEKLKRSSAHNHLSFRLVFGDGVLLQAEDGTVFDSWPRSSPEPIQPRPPEAPQSPAAAAAIEPAANALSAHAARTKSPEIVEPARKPTSPLTVPKVLTRQRPSEILVPSSQESDGNSSSDNVETTEENPSSSNGRQRPRRVRKRDMRRSERGTLHERKGRNPPAPAPQPVATSPVAGPSTPRQPVPHAPTSPVVATTPDGRMASTSRATWVVPDSSQLEYVWLKAVKAMSGPRRVSVIGIVAACAEPKETRSREYARVLHVTDDSLDPGDYFYVHCFSNRKEWLPNVKEGQVILLRQLRLSDWQGQLRGLGYKDTFSWVAFDARQGEPFVSDPQLQPFPGGQHFPFVRPNRDEIARFVQLSDWWSLQEGTKVIIPPPAEPRKRVLVKDMQPKIFCDCVAEVIRVFQDLTYTVVYISDYTAHEHNRDVGELERPNPSGKHTLKLVLWDVQKDTPIVAGPGQYYLIRNIRPHIDKEGLLEGNLSGTGQYFIPLEASDPEVAELVQHRSAYWSNERPRSPVASPQRKVVRCFHTQQPLHTVRDVVESKLKNAKYRVQGRVTDFYPQDVADFVVTYCKKCEKFVEEKKQRNCALCFDDLGEHRMFRYRFCLRFEDKAGQSMEVNVEGDDAAVFLGRLDAQDLHEDDDALQAVKARLRLVLGNLIDVHDHLAHDDIIKAELGPHFDFCVQSWEMENGQRGYNLFGCMIVIPS